MNRRLPSPGRLSWVTEGWGAPWGHQEAALYLGKVGVGIGGVVPPGPGQRFRAVLVKHGPALVAAAPRQRAVSQGFGEDYGRTGRATDGADTGLGVRQVLPVLRKWKGRFVAPRYTREAAVLGPTSLRLYAATRRPLLSLRSPLR